MNLILYWKSVCVQWRVAKLRWLESRSAQSKIANRKTKIKLQFGWATWKEYKQKMLQQWKREDAVGKELRASWSIYAQASQIDSGKEQGNEVDKRVEARGHILES